MEGERDKRGDGGAQYLPIEIYALIFTFLSLGTDFQSVSLVNKLWRRQICAMRTSTTFRTQLELDLFPWATYPNVKAIQVNELSLQSVPFDQLRGITVKTGMKDYQHLVGIQTLHLREVYDTQDTAMYLDTFSNIQCLDLHRQPPLPESCVHSLTNLTSLMMWECPQARYLLSSLTNLMSLEISSSAYRCCAADVSLFSTLNQLTSLVLIWNRVQNMKEVYHLTKLQALRIEACSISQSDSEHLIRLTRLTSLNLRDNALKGIGDFSPLTQLVRLDVGENLIGPLRAEKLPVSLQSLKMDSNKVLNIEAEFRRRLTRLTDLDMDNNKLSGALRNLPTSLVRLSAACMGLTDIGYITSLVDLRSCDLSGNKIYEVPELGGNSRLETIDLRGNRLGLEIGPPTGASPISVLYNSD